MFRATFIPFAVLLLIAVCLGASIEVGDVESNSVDDNSNETGKKFIFSSFKCHFNILD